MQVRVYYETSPISTGIVLSRQLSALQWSAACTNHLRLMGAEQNALFSEAAAGLPVVQSNAFVVRSMQLDFLKPGA